MTTKNRTSSWHYKLTLPTNVAISVISRITPLHVEKVYTEWTKYVAYVEHVQFT